jgi:hypothetical protein
MLNLTSLQSKQEQRPTEHRFDVNWKYDITTWNLKREDK